MKQYRQGDVLLKHLSKAPRGERKKRESGVLAFGEVTGHTHTLADLEAAEVYELDGGLFLSVTAEGGVAIQHQEHGTIEIPTGDYAVVLQREYTPTEIRTVLD